MDSQSNVRLKSAEPPPQGHMMNSSLSSLSSLPSTSNAISPMICSTDITTSTTPLLSSCQPSVRSKIPASLVSSSSYVKGTNGTTNEAPSISIRPTPEIIQSASKQELQEMLNVALDKNLKLEAIVREARMSAAHHKLHHNLLSIESQEALNRMEVENFMLQREVSIMRQNPLDPAQIEYKKMLKEHCKAVKEENIALRLRLKKARCVIKLQNWKLSGTQQAINLLQERIRQNRRHINEMRRPGGPLFHFSTPLARADTSHDYSTAPYLNPTPNNCRSLQKKSQITRENREKFNALLLAGSLLNQESTKNSPPAMHYHQPSSNLQFQKQDLQAKNHSNTSEYLRDPNILLPPVKISPNSGRGLESHLPTLSRFRIRRRKSRDSTISASDVEELSHSCVKENNDLESKLYHSENRTHCSRDRTNNHRENKTNYNEELHKTFSTTSITKRKRDDELPWWNREGRKDRNKEAVGLAMR